MPGVPGKGGPAPKRSNQRRRRNEPAIPIDKVERDGPVGVPPPDPRWDPLAVAWYASLAESGQSAHYEPSDWQTARWCAHMMTEVVRAEELNASALGQVRGLMTDLLCTESSRRRVQIEVERTKSKPLPGEVPSLDDYRARLTS